MPISTFQTKSPNNLHFLKYLFFIITLFTLNSLNMAQSEIDSSISYSRAYVSIDGYNLFLVRGIASFPADERADAISEKIDLIASDDAISPNSIQIIHEKFYDELIINDISLVRIFDSDSNLEGISREAFSMGVKQRIIKAIYSYRYERTKEVIIRRSIYALVTVLICFLILVLVHLISKKLQSFLENKIRKKLDTIETKSFQLIRSNQIWITFYSLFKTLKFVIILAIVFATTEYVLGQFPWTRSISVSLLGMFTKPFLYFVTSLIDFIPNFAFLLVIFFITKYLLKLIKLLSVGLSHGNFTISGFDPDWALPTYKILRLFLVAFAVIVAYPYIPGSESAAFKGVSLFIGVLFSLGSSSLIGNLIAGYTMTYRKTFKMGDLVQIDDKVGQVMEVKLFVTRLKTIKNEEIVIPNSNVLSTNVINYSTHAKDNGLILHSTVGIGYETPWRQVEGILKLAADRTEGVLKEPAPFVLQKTLGDFAVNYEINVYIKDVSNRSRIYTYLHQNILDLFNENNIQIMTPAYEGDPEVPKVVPKDQWFTPVKGK